jgi:hypothetical protein
VNFGKRIFHFQKTRNFIFTFSIRKVAKTDKNFRYFYNKFGYHMACSTTVFYYYCHVHDDGYRSLCEGDLYEHVHCCTSHTLCELKHIGNDENENSLPSIDWFNQRGGGYKKSYLKDAPFIVLGRN